MSSAQKAAIKLVNFNWAKCDESIYELDGRRVTFKANGEDYYRPVLGDLELKPNTGKYFYEFRTNGENMRVGVAEANVNQKGEMGSIDACYSVNLQTGDCQVSGETHKKLWRLVVPVAGGIFGVLYDTDAGTMQLYMNQEFHGTPINEKFNLKGKTVYPCVGIAGVEQHNRDIGVGKKNVLVTENPELYRTIIL